MFILNKIEFEEFNYNKKRNKYDDIIIDEMNISTYYELQVDDDISFAVCGNEYYKPGFRIVFDYYAIWYGGNCYFYSSKEIIRIKNYSSLIYVYDVFSFENSIIVISEVDVYILNEKLEEKQHIILEDIVIKYEILNNRLVIELDNGKIIEI